MLSGLPSTLWALVSRRDPVDASVAAGSILLPGERSRVRLVMAAVPVHLSLSAIWGIAMAAALPRKNPAVEGAIAGLLIAALDLGIIGRRFPRIRALEWVPQIADHVAFGAIHSHRVEAAGSFVVIVRRAGPRKLVGWKQTLTNIGSPTSSPERIRGLLPFSFDLRGGPQVIVE